MKKRKSQVCRVYRVKIDFSHLNEQQRTHLKMLFVEAKWLYNDALTFMNDHDINDYDTKKLTVQGLDKAKLVVHERVTVLSSREPTTKYCPVCGKLKKDIKLADRLYECPCGYKEDRDVHAARNMILLNKINTCGTQEINAFGEDVRHRQNIAVQPR